MSFGLDKSLVNLIQSVFAQYPEISKVIIYGSRAKGNFRQGSDIDLTLIGEGLKEDRVSSLKIALDDLSTPYLFDVSIFENLNSPELEQHIHRVGKTFYSACET